MLPDEFGFNGVEDHFACQHTPNAFVIIDNLWLVLGFRIEEFPGQFDYSVERDHISHQP
jgi:hypothetical protein